MNINLQSMQVIQSQGRPGTPLQHYAISPSADGKKAFGLPVTVFYNNGDGTYQGPGCENDVEGTQYKALA